MFLNAITENLLSSCFCYCKNLPLSLLGRRSIVIPGPGRLVAARALQNTYLSIHWMDFLCLKFYGMCYDIGRESSLDQIAPVNKTLAVGSMPWYYSLREQQKSIQIISGQVHSAHQVNLFLAVTKQLYKWYFPSVPPSVCLSHLFLTMFPSSHHHGIFRSYYQWPK